MLPSRLAYSKKIDYKNVGTSMGKEILQQTLGGRVNCCAI